MNARRRGGGHGGTNRRSLVVPDTTTGATAARHDRHGDDTEPASVAQGDAVPCQTDTGLDQLAKGYQPVVKHGVVSTILRDVRVRPLPDGADARRSDHAWLSGERSNRMRIPSAG